MKEFEYKNIEKDNNDNNIFMIIILITGILLLVFISIFIAIFCYLKYKKKNNKIDDKNQGRLLNETQSDA